jgi:gliding motility-associated-like protein
MSIFGSSTLKAQVDKEFWFAVPFVGNHGNGNSELVINNAKNVSVTVNISTPADLQAGSLNNTVTVAAGASMRVPLRAFYGTSDQNNGAQALGRYQQGVIANTIRNTGLYVTSSDSITVYYEVGSGGGQNCDIFSLKGANALGTDFMLPTQNHFNNWGDVARQAYTAADIVATENGTIVTITPSTAAEGRPVGVPFTITLNKGQTYCLRSAGKNANQQLNGTTITSNKLIAVTIIVDSIDTGSDNTWGNGNGGIDMAGDQIVPISLLGKEYIVVRGNAGNNGDRNRIFVLTTEANTKVEFYNNNAIDNNFNNITPNAGTTINYLQPTIANATYIKSDKPIYVFYISGTLSELGGALIPPIKCTGSNNVVVSRTSNNPFYLVVLSQNKFINGFLVDNNNGIIQSSNFTPVIGVDGDPEGYSAAKIDFNTVGPISNNSFPVTDAVRITNIDNKAVFHIGTSNGGGAGSGSTARFGYFSDFASVNISYENKPVCFGESLTLDAGPGKDSYEWYTFNPLGSKIKVVLSSSQTYKVDKAGVNKIYLTVKKKNCDLNDSVEVYVQPQVNLNVLRRTIVCNDQPFVVNATPEVTNPPINVVKYRWRKEPPTGTPASPADTIGITASIQPQLPVGNHKLYVFVTDDKGCVNKDSVFITINPIPAVSVGNVSDKSTCSGIPVELGFQNTNPNLVFRWNSKGTPIPTFLRAIGLSDTTLSNPTANHNISGNQDVIFPYYLTTTDTSTSCVKIDNLLLTVHPNPTAQIDAPVLSDYCKSPQTVNLLGSAPGFTGGTTVFTLNQDATSISSFDPNNLNIGANTIFLDYTSANNCKAPQVSKPITVSALPAINLTDVEYCSGQSVQIGVQNPDPNYDYTWNQTPDIVQVNDPTVSINVENNTNANQSNTYTLTATNKNNINCLASGNVTVTIKPLPKPTITNALSFCEGAPTLNLSANPAGGQFFINNVSNAVTSFNPDNSGNYNLVYKLSVNNCEGQDSKTIIVNSLPDPQILGIGQADYCSGDQDIIISAIPAGGNFIQGNSGNFSLNNSGTNSITQTFEYTVTDANQCTNSVSSTINIHPLPILSVVNSSPICQGQEAVLTASGGDKYEWSGLSSTNNVLKVKPLITSQYPVKAVSNKGCKSPEQQIEVVVNRTPNANFPQKSLTHCFEEGNLPLFAGFASNYSWSNGETIDTLKVTQGGLYVVTLSEGVCNSVDSVLVIAACPPRIFVPKSFSPNNDGYNDSLQVFGDHFKDFSILIYNRWGEVVYESSDSTKMWDGSYKGQQMPAGVYPYVITYKSDILVDKNKLFSLNGSINVIY